MFYRDGTSTSQWQVVKAIAGDPAGLSSDGEHFYCSENPEGSDFEPDTSIEITEQGNYDKAGTFDFTMVRQFAPHANDRETIKAGSMKAWLTWNFAKSRSATISTKPLGTNLDSLAIEWKVLSQDPPNKEIVDREWQEVLDIRDKFEGKSKAKKLVGAAVAAVALV